MSVTDALQAEYKAGYRDALQAGVIVAQTCAADPTATAADVLELLSVLTESSVIQPEPCTCRETMGERCIPHRRYPPKG